MKQPIVIQREHLRLGGDLATGALLSQIAHWAAQPDIYWIAKTREEWMAETGLTLEQYKRAIGVLKQKGLVEVKIMKHNGVTMTHVRLAPKEPKTPTGGPKGSKEPTGSGETHQPDRSTSILHSTEERSSTSIGEANQDLRKEENLKKTRRTYGVEGSTGEYKSKRKDIASPSITHKGWLMKASEILKHWKAPTTGNLGSYWKSRMVLVYGGHQKPLTVKEQGQLKQLHKYLGDQTRPVIDYAINHWIKVSVRAGAIAGTSYPSEPHIGFLLKHHAVVVNLLTPEVTPTPSPKVVKAPVPMVATGTEDETPHVLTAQELTELLAWLKSP